MHASQSQGDDALTCTWAYTHTHTHTHTHENFSTRSSDTLREDISAVVRYSSHLTNGTNESEQRSIAYLNEIIMQNGILLEDFHLLTLGLNVIRCCLCLTLVVRGKPRRTAGITHLTTGMRRSSTHTSPSVDNLLPPLTRCSDAINRRRDVDQMLRENKNLHEQQQQ